MVGEVCVQCFKKYIQVSWDIMRNNEMSKIDKIPLHIEMFAFFSTGKHKRKKLYIEFDALFIFLSIIWKQEIMTTKDLM